MNNNQKIGLGMAAAVVLVAVVLVVVVLDFAFSGKSNEEVIAPAPVELVQVNPDAHASLIVFSVNVRYPDSIASTIDEATIIYGDYEKDAPKWKRNSFRANLKKSVVREEGELYVFTFLGCDGRTVLHGQIHQDALQEVKSKHCGPNGNRTLMAYDVRLWNQIQHQPVTATFDSCRVEVGNRAHSGKRKF